MLILAATPIGNLQDASPRLRRTLLEADHLYAEDTRQTAKLLKHFDIQRPLSSFHEHSPLQVRERIGTLLEQGAMVVYVSDAGMPGISDPGFELVNLALERAVEVDVLPGPSAVVNALVLSGLPNHEFCFLGFFPGRGKKQDDLIERLRVLAMTSIFFEAPSRIIHTLAYLAKNIPETPIALCRELTKLHQEVIRGRADEVVLSTVKGEMVLVIGPVTSLRKQVVPQVRHQQLLSEGKSPAQAAKVLAKELGLSKREVYSQLHRKDGAERTTDDEGL